MKILMLSTDEKIFENSPTRGRMIEYGNLVDELHVVVYTKNKKEKAQISDRVFIYPVTPVRKRHYFKEGRKVAGEILQEGGPWLITSQDPFETGLLGYKLKKMFNIPLQIQIHTDFLSPYFQRESIKNLIRSLIAKKLIKKADCLRVVSERIKKSVESFIGRKSVAILPIYVDVEQLKSKPIQSNLRNKYPGYEFIALMASRLTKEKNIGLALKVFSTIVKEKPHSLLVIVGSGPEQSSLESQVNSLGLEKNVKIEPEANDLSSYYKTADLFLTTSNYEGYGRTFIEAAAAGLPIITTDVGIALGRKFPVGDKNGLSAAVKDVVNNTVLRQQIVSEQNKYIGDWPTKEVYLSKMKKSWETCHV